MTAKIDLKTVAGFDPEAIMVMPGYDRNINGRRKRNGGHQGT